MGSKGIAREIIEKAQKDMHELIRNIEFHMGHGKLRDVGDCRVQIVRAQRNLNELELLLNSYYEQYTFELEQYRDEEEKNG